MMRIRRSKTGASIVSLEWSSSITTSLFLSSILIATIGSTRGDYLMGGHLDNKDAQSSFSRRNDGEPEGVSRDAVTISSRTANIDDLDFDLGLDFLSDQNPVDPSRMSSEESTIDVEETGIAPRYRVPLAPYAFNGGQPFSLEKDPITGQIDFEKAPPLKALEYSVKSPEDDESPLGGIEDSSETISNTATKLQSDDNVGPNEINPYSPSFHDFLNLPVRYTYNKYENAEKYPLISSSYANTKVQSGSNSYNTYNHKKYHESVKASVNMHLQPSRKTHIQSVTRGTTTTTTRKPQTEQSSKITTAFTTPKATTTEATTTTQKPTTTTFMSTTKHLINFPPVTTWKPQKHGGSNSNKYHGDDYEATLPIERLQSNSNQQSTTDSPPSMPSSPMKEDEANEEYEEGYEDYDRVYQSSDKPMTHDDHEESGETDYSYGLDFFGVGSRPSMKPSAQTTTEKQQIFTTVAATTEKSTSTTLKIDDQEENLSTTTTTTTTSMPVEEKRVTSMPLDTSDHYISNYPNNGPITGTIDNSIPSVTSNVIYHQLRPSSNDQYYGRPSMGMSAPGIVVKSTSNVVVPPGQDTVSFVLGNRQSVGGAGDAGGEYYPVHSGSISDQSVINFGKIGRPNNNVDNYPGPGQMIVSAGIGVGSNNVGSYANQRPQNLPFDHALVSVGLPTVDVVNPGDVQTGVTKNTDFSTSNAVDSLAQKWWASTISTNTKQQSNLQQPNLQQEPPNQPQFGYHVVFPDEVKNPGASNDAKPTEEHVIVVHESELGAGNTLHLELPSQQQTSTSNPTTSFRFETTTMKFAGKPEEHGGLPELSESLTPPTERPNKLQLGHRLPNYNYYQHQTLPSRPNEYPRPQRVPLPPPLPSPQSSGSSNSNNFKRRPTSSLESNLPNILPQFRPNAKVSHGHNRGDNNVGTIPAGALNHYPNTIIRRPPSYPQHHHHHHLYRPTSPRRPTGPSHLQRLNPPPLPPPPPPITSLRLPTPAALVAQTPSHDSQPQISDNIARLTVQKRLSVGVPATLNIDERHQTFGSPSQQIKSRLEDDNLERFSAEPPQQPPRAPFFGKLAATDGNDQEIPRIATLQMIQQHNSGDESIVKTKLPSPYIFNIDKRPINRQDNQEIEGNSRDDNHGEENESNSSDLTPSGVDSTDSSVYVVYPVKGALDIRPTSHESDDNGPEDATVVLGKYGSQRPLPPDTLLKDSNDESISNDHHNYRPSSSSPPQLASDFPYPLERPDPSMFTGQLREKPLLVPSEQEKNNQDEEKNDDIVVESNSNQPDNDRDAVNVIPYPQDHIPFGLGEHSGAISATLNRLSGFSSIVDSSSTPIAYVYTPTMRPPIRRPEEGYSHSTFDRVLLQSQHPSDANSGPAAPQNFMAPFVASASAEAPTKNGWSVVIADKSPTETMDRRRADTDVQSESSSKEESNDDKNDGKTNDEKEDIKKEETDGKDNNTQTEKNDFNLENFTPELFGGFQPIFEFPSDSDTDPTLGDKVSAGALAIETPRSGTGRNSRKLEND